MYQENVYQGVAAMPAVTDELLTRKDVCRLFKVSLQSVIRMEKSGELPAVRLGAGSVRYRRSDVLAFITRSIGGKQ